jgi:hypothetical protein
VREGDGYGRGDGWRDDAELRVGRVSVVLNVTVASQWRLSGVSVASHLQSLLKSKWCHSGVTGVESWCYSSVRVMLQWRHSSVIAV